MCEEGKKVQNGSVTEGAGLGNRSICRRNPASRVKRRHKFPQQTYSRDQRSLVGLPKEMNGGLDATSWCIIANFLKQKENLVGVTASTTEIQ